MDWGFIVFGLFLPGTGIFGVSFMTIEGRNCRRLRERGIRTTAVGHSPRQDMG
jgi:hypothetical protein